MYQLAERTRLRGCPRWSRRCCRNKRTDFGSEFRGLNSSGRGVRRTRTRHRGPRASAWRACRRIDPALNGFRDELLKTDSLEDSLDPCCFERLETAAAAAAAVAVARPKIRRCPNHSDCFEFGREKTFPTWGWRLERVLVKMEAEADRQPPRFWRVRC